MVSVMLTIMLIIALLFSISFVVIKRKKLELLV